MQYAILLVYCQDIHGQKFCVLRGLESVLSPSGVLIKNEFDCPLLHLTCDVFIRKPSHIKKAVSVIHECGDSCKFVSVECARSVERETVTSKRIEFKHDVCTNTMYCLNIYCINS